MPVTKTRFLREAIESALGQGYERLEVVALDDGSSDDEMPDLLESYAERHPGRFRFVRHDNAGQSETINRGIAMAAGELAGYLSDDDLLRPGAVSRLVQVFGDAPDAVVAYPGYEIIDEGGTVIDTITPTEYSFVDSVRLHDSIVGAGALFRVDAFRRIGGWDTGLRYRADYDFWLRLAALGGIHRVPEPLAAWRFHGTASTVADAGVRMSRESVKVIDKVFADEPVAPELEAVRGEAYRNAFIQAAMVLTLGSNDPSERFYVYDRHMPKISRTAGTANTTPDALLNAQLAALTQDVARLQAEVAHRDERVAYLGRPWWWRMSRRLTPDPLRPWAKRLGSRVLRRLSVSP